MYLDKFPYLLLENGRKCRCLKGVIKLSLQRLTFWPCDQILKVGRAINWYLRV